MPKAQPEYTSGSMPQPDLGVHHAGAQDLDPALALAGGAALAAALVALDVQLAARLGEREVVGAETGNGALAVDLFDNEIEHRFEVRHGHALVPLSMTMPSI